MTVPFLLRRPRWMAVSILPLSLSMIILGDVNVGEFPFRVSLVVRLQMVGLWEESTCQIAVQSFLLRGSGLQNWELIAFSPDLKNRSEAPQRLLCHLRTTVRAGRLAASSAQISRHGTSMSLELARWLFGRTMPARPRRNRPPWSLSDVVVLRGLATFPRQQAYWTETGAAQFT